LEDHRRQLGEPIWRRWGRSLGLISNWSQNGECDLSNLRSMLFRLWIIKRVFRLCLVSEIEGTDLPDRVIPFERNEQQGLTKSSNRGCQNG
jgi:hypothetical protein